MPITFNEEQQHIIDFLQGQNVAVLATVDQTGEPHGAAIYYTFDRNSMNFFFITKRNTAKSHNLEHNDRVALTIYDEDVQATVQIKGSVVEEKEAAKTESVFRDIWRTAMTTSKADAPPLVNLQAGPYVVYRLIPKSVRMATFVRSDPERSSQIFESI